MGFYDVVAPCVVGKLHYARPTTQPIEVDDDVAAPLVESGALRPYGQSIASPVGWPEDAERPDSGPYADPVVDDGPPTDPPPARKSRGRRSQG